MHGLKDQPPKLATGLEHFTAHGFHSMPATTTMHKRSPLIPILQVIGDTKLKALAGRGMSIPTMSAWMMWVFGNTVPRQRTVSARIMRGITFSVDVDNVDDLELE